jgi:hypothetical protein
MGMFDYVNYKTNCPTCQKEIDGFQTKDTGCDMETVEFWETDIFYSSCDYCNTWVEFRRKAAKPRVPIEDYQMYIIPSNCDESQFMRNTDGKIVGICGKTS